MEENEIESTSNSIVCDGSQILQGAVVENSVVGLRCVIGENAESGVIDKDHKVFGYENLYVCDGSAISANPGVNPALTISAMTELAMSKIPHKK